MTTFDLDRFLRPDVQEMETYTPIVPFDVLSTQLGIPPEKIIKLDANENPYGPSPLVRHALAEAAYLHSYPDPESRVLCQHLSHYTKTPVEHLMAGHGSDELIDLIMRLFIRPDDRVLNCPPTFGMYSFDTAINSGTIIDIPRRADFSLDIEGIETAAKDERAKLLFLASPNNPDGSVIVADDLVRLLKLPLIIIIDEAYAEFHKQSFITWVRDHPNLIVLRTFSKWAGLAGLRVGYGAFPLEIIAHLWKIKQPYNVNLAGQLAAEVSLQEADYLLEKVALIIETRQQLEAGLAQIDWLAPYPSQANFILCKVLRRDAAQLKADLAQHGILIRHYSTSRLNDHVRFSVGTPEQIQQLLEVLQIL